MGYRVHKDNDSYKVVEVLGGDVKTIFDNLPEEKAKRLSYDLNFGSGFDGWTPDFFLTKAAVAA